MFTLAFMAMAEEDLEERLIRKIEEMIKRVREATEKLKEEAE